MTEVPFTRTLMAPTPKGVTSWARRMLPVLMSSLLRRRVLLGCRPGGSPAGIPRRRYACWSARPRSAPRLARSGSVPAKRIRPCCGSPSMSVAAPLRPVPVAPLPGPLPLPSVQELASHSDVGDAGALAQQRRSRRCTHASRERVRAHVGTDLPDVRNCGGVQRTAEDRRGERSHRRRLDLSVQPLVVGSETLVVAAVAGLGRTIDQ